MRAADAAVSGKAVFDAVREGTGFTVGLSALLASEVVNVLTLAAETRPDDGSVPPPP